MRLPLVALAALLPCLWFAPANAGDPPPSPLAGADAKARIALAQELKKKDAAALAKALSALGASKTKEPDRDFLAQYALQENERGLRLVALEAASRLDRKATADWFRARADGKEEFPTVISLESLGYVGTKDDVAPVLELIKSPNELIAVAAANAAARLGASKDLAAIAENGLAHASDHVTDHTAWAVQDILKKPKLAIGWYEKYTKKSDPRSVRASATIAMLEDNLAEPHDFGDALKLAKETLLAAPAAIEIKTANDEYRKNALAALDWLKKSLPGGELLVRAAAKRIDIPGKVPDGFVDVSEDVIQVPLTWAIQPPHKLAYHIFQMGTVLWQKRVGEPFKSHRGWEPAIFDAYDLCAIARLYDAGPGGLSRSNFMKDMVAKHPWGSQ
jgi:hypothetical protein